MSNQVNIFQWNCRSINANRYSFSNYLSHQDIDIIVLVETWLKPGQAFAIRGYNCIRKDRADGKAGVAILISNKLNFSEIVLKNNYNSGIMACAVRIAMRVPLDIMAIYRPPNIRDSRLDWVNLFGQCNVDSCFIAGDFNIHNSSWGCYHNDRSNVNFIDAIDELYLCVLNNGDCTHISSAGRGSAIDLTLVSAKLIAHCNWDVHSDTLGSDHYPILIQYTSEKPNSTHIYPTSRWNIIDTDWEKYTQLLENFCEDMAPITHAKDIYAHLLEQINRAGEIVFKIKKPFQTKKNKAVCWWDGSCNAAVSNRKSALQRYKSDPSLENYIAYKRICAETKKHLKSKARASWRNFCEQLNRETPVNKIWQKIRSIKSGHTPTQPIPENILIDLLHKLTPDSVEPCSEVQDSRELPVHMLSTPFTLFELNRVLKINTNTSPGIDNVLYPMIKYPVMQKVCCWSCLIKYT